MKFLFIRFFNAINLFIRYSKKIVRANRLFHFSAPFEHNSILCFSRWLMCREGSKFFITSRTKGSCVEEIKRDARQSRSSYEPKANSTLLYRMNQFLTNERLFYLLGFLVFLNFLVALLTHLTLIGWI